MAKCGRQNTISSGHSGCSRDVSEVRAALRSSGSFPKPRESMASRWNDFMGLWPSLEGTQWCGDLLDHRSSSQEMSALFGLASEAQMAGAGPASGGLQKPQLCPSPSPCPVPDAGLQPCTLHSCVLISQVPMGLCQTIVFLKSSLRDQGNWPANEQRKSLPGFKSPQLAS